jgi:hypothetical protein
LPPPPFHTNDSLVEYVAVPLLVSDGLSKKLMLIVSGCVQSGVSLAVSRRVPSAVSSADLSGESETVGVSIALLLSVSDSLSLELPRAVSCGDGKGDPELVPVSVPSGVFAASGNRGSLGFSQNLRLRFRICARPRAGR